MPGRNCSLISFSIREEDYLTGGGPFLAMGAARVPAIKQAISNRKDPIGKRKTFVEANVELRKLCEK